METNGKAPGEGVDKEVPFMTFKFTIKVRTLRLL